MKISPISYLISGLAIGLIAFFYGLFIQWIPNTSDAAAYRKNTDMQNEQAALMPKAQRRVENTLALVNAKDAAWQKFVATRTPTDNLATNGINLNVNAYQLGIDTDTYRDSIQRAVNKQLRMGGVKVLNAPTIPMLDPNVEVNSILSTFYNYPAIPFPVVIFDFGTITVQGTYSQIMNHLRAYKNMPNYLAVSDGLTLTGTSPLLTATYNLSMVGFIRGKHIFPAVSEQNTGTGGRGGGLGGGPGGGRFGPPGGFGGPGGPPGGFGGPGGPPGGPGAGGPRRASAG
jgi:hypothetical protein